MVVYFRPSYPALLGPGRKRGQDLIVGGPVPFPAQALRPNTAILTHNPDEDNENGKLVLSGEFI
jgi:hypothetical protein